MSLRTIKISVSRTVQVERFEPVSVTVEETVQVKDDDTDAVAEARMGLYKAVTQQVTRYTDNEVRKYRKKKAEEAEE